MVVEMFRTSGENGCEVIARETLGGTLVAWRFLLNGPASLVLAFLNDAYETLRASEEETISDEQAMYYRETFARGNGALLRDMINHVLVCEEERGFDPIVRLAAYSFANGMLDLSPVTSYAERVSLETSVLGAEATQWMSERWNALLAEHKLRPFPCREEFFKALVQDAEAAKYPFELGVSTEFSSLPQLLKAFVAEMIHKRVLLCRCELCGRYALAAEEELCLCGEETAG